MPQLSITEICLKITYLKIHSNSPGADGLMLKQQVIITPNIALIRIAPREYDKKGNVTPNEMTCNEMTCNEMTYKNWK